MLKSSVLYSWFFLVLFLFIYNTWDFNEGIIIRMSYFFRESFLCWAIIIIVGEQICLYIYIFITVILTNKTSNKYGSLRRNGEYDSGNYALLFNCCIPLSLVCCACKMNNEYKEHHCNQKLSILTRRIIYSLMIHQPQLIYIGI